jgi:hypothetical protein
MRLVSLMLPWALKQYIACGCRARCSNSNFGPLDFSSSLGECTVVLSFFFFFSSFSSRPSSPATRLLASLEPLYAFPGYLLYTFRNLQWPTWRSQYVAVTSMEPTMTFRYTLLQFVSAPQRPPRSATNLFIVIVFFASIFGAGFPVVAKKVKWMKIPPPVFFFCKHFGTGVLIATAFVHVSIPAIGTYA